MTDYKYDIPEFDIYGRPIDREKRIRESEERRRREEEEFEANCEVYDALHEKYGHVLSKERLRSSEEDRECGMVELAIAAFLAYTDDDVLFEESILKKIRISDFNYLDPICKDSLSYLYENNRIIPETPGAPVRLSPEIMKAIGYHYGCTCS